MSLLAKRLMMCSGGEDALYVKYVFSTDLYTGTGTNRTITNGIDLSGEGGMVWIKCRDLYQSSPQHHVLFDTERGVYKRLHTDTTDQEDSTSYGLSAFLNTGYSLTGSFSGEWNGFNAGLGSTYVGWTFRKSPKFFDVVTWTGDGAASKTISHNLGVAPGMIIAKNLAATDDWYVYHRSNTANPETDHLVLNTTAATADDIGAWNDTAPTDTQFTVGTNDNVNATGEDYVAYLFAHDAEDDGVIQCGSYTGNGSATGPSVTLGWKPQFLLIKNTSNTGDWIILDNARDTTNPRTEYLEPNTTDIEGSGRDVDFNATGFQIKSTDAAVNTNTDEYIYMAIREE